MPTAIPCTASSAAPTRTATPLTGTCPASGACSSTTVAPPTAAAAAARCSPSRPLSSPTARPNAPSIMQRTARTGTDTPSGSRTGKIPARMCNIAFPTASSWTRGLSGAHGNSCVFNESNGWLPACGCKTRCRSRQLDHLKNSSFGVSGHHRYQGH
ncbi:hypothetical protein LZ30DRAFT_231519 [Colletotrichum cereale]|nr:hypothetical protein LZ30DRAFT_231519 [Colletotrichum cereale]